MLQKTNSAGLEMKASSAVQQCLEDITAAFLLEMWLVKSAEKDALEMQAWTLAAHITREMSLLVTNKLCHFILLALQSQQGFKQEAKLLYGVHLQHTARHNTSGKCTL